MCRQSKLYRKKKMQTMNFMIKQLMTKEMFWEADSHRHMKRNTSKSFLRCPRFADKWFLEKRESMNLKFLS
jgi:hypothetical protein